MSELEFRFPSDQPYAYFGVKGTPEELAAMDFELLAKLYVNTQFAVLKGTVDAKDAILGSARCICGETACESENCDCDTRACPVDHAADEDPPVASPLARQYEASADALKEYAVGDSVEVGGITFTKHSEAVTALSEGLGATVLSEENTPPEKPKAPWEKGKPKPVISSDDFDF